MVAGVWLCVNNAQRWFAPLVHDGEFVIHGPWSGVRASWSVVRRS